MGTQADGQAPTRTKEHYERPEVQRIKLTPGEMAATGCKTPTGPGRGVRCRFGVGGCSATGS